MAQHKYTQARTHARARAHTHTQGDAEKARGMKVSFLMDRDKPGVTKSQIGFLDFVVRAQPLNPKP